MKFRISISPATLILICCMIATTPLQQLTAYFCAAAIHEIGHLIAAKLLLIDLTDMKLDILGARLSTTGRLYSYPALAALCFAGPLINFVCFGLSFPFAQRSDWLLEFCRSSLSLGVLNLIPIEGFDGGRILEGMIHKLLPFHMAQGICKLICFLSLLTLWMLSVWMLLLSGTSLTLFVFSCLLFCMLFI